MVSIKAGCDSAGVVVAEFDVQAVPSKLYDLYIREALPLSCVAGDPVDALPFMSAGPTLMPTW